MEDMTTLIAVGLIVIVAGTGAVSGVAKLVLIEGHSVVELWNRLFGKGDKKG
jgi:hypothetical protein